MKLTVKDEKVIFDYTDVDMNVSIKSPHYIKAAQCREFLYKTNCEWKPTETPQVDELVYPRTFFSTLIQSARLHKDCLVDCECKASFLSCIEITQEFEALLHKVEADCKQFWEKEIAEQNKRNAQERWERLCGNGCEGCTNLCYLLDQPVCNHTGKELQERNSPVYSGNTLRLFNLVPIPSQDCPFKPAEPAVYAPAPAYSELFPFAAI